MRGLERGHVSFKPLHTSGSPAEASAGLGQRGSGHVEHVEPRELGINQTVNERGNPTTSIDKGLHVSSERKLVGVQRLALNALCQQEFAAGVALLERERSQRPFSAALLARILHDGSSRKRVAAWRDGRVEPRSAEAYLDECVEGLSGEPARRQACCSRESALAPEALTKNAG